MLRMIPEMTGMIGMIAMIATCTPSDDQGTVGRDLDVVDEKDRKVRYISDR